MKTFQLKTNLKCNHCVSKVKTQLDSVTEIRQWSIDLKSPDRIMTVESDDERVVEKVLQILVDTGFRAEICSE